MVTAVTILSSGLENLNSGLNLVLCVVHEIIIVRPPIGNPDSDPDDFCLPKKTLYGLRRSPQHWYNLITKILTDMGLTASKLPTLRRIRLEVGNYEFSFSQLSGILDK